jgi:hypothetical protein
VSLPLFAQDRAADVKTAFARAQHLKHGINASEWFAQHSHDYSAKYTDGYTDDTDIALMAKLGFDSVRLSIDPVPLEQSMNHWGSGPMPTFLRAWIGWLTQCWRMGWPSRSTSTLRNPTSRR